MTSSEEISFRGHAGDLLSARLSTTFGPARATALFAHCFTCSKDIWAVKWITRSLADRGIATLSFDFTGLGHSEGEFANTSFSSNVVDLKIAAEELKKLHEAPSLLIGHSLGGAAVLRAAPDIPSVRGVVTIGAPADPSHVSRLFSGDVDAIHEKGSAVVDLGGRPFTITNEFLEDIRETKLADSIRQMDAALLVLHSPQDQIVGIENAAIIFDSAKHPKSFVSLDNADHLVRKEVDARYIASVISSWSNRYLPTVIRSVDTRFPDGATTVRERAPGRFTQDVLVANKHNLVVDEPSDLGGNDEGPTPYQFICIALGACTSMTIRLYARRKEIPLLGVTVEVSHSKRHAIECEGCDAESVTSDHFERIITLQGELTQSQVDSLLSIADKCPIHRTLAKQSLISTHLARKDALS